MSVTGYQRNEIIPRNCRFLQGRNTHQASVRRLHKKIQKQEESVELLLNYKKNGEPFWNLLYTTPLFDSNGKLIFFLGGQINCSTTIHSTSDVLRILAQSKDPVDAADSGTATPQLPQPTKPPRTRRLLSAFRNNSTSNVLQKAPGMEKELLNQIEGVPLKDQINTFYTAYSNVSHPLSICNRPLKLTYMMTVHHNKLQQLSHHLHLHWPAGPPLSDKSGKGGWGSQQQRHLFHARHRRRCFPLPRQPRQWLAELGFQEYHQVGIEGWECCERGAQIVRPPVHGL